MSLLLWLLEPVTKHRLKDVRNVLADLRSGSETAWSVAETLGRLLAALELVCKVRAKWKR
jgi:hypothetical protein